MVEPTQLTLTVNAILWIVIPFAGYYIGILIHWRFLTDREYETLKRNSAFGIRGVFFATSCGGGPGRKLLQTGTNKEKITLIIE